MHCGAGAWPNAIYFCGADARVRSRPPGRLFGFRRNFDKPGEGARRGSGDPPHQFMRKWEKYVALGQGPAPHLVLCVLANKLSNEEQAARIVI
jgi:hypothetical protein